MLQEFFESSLGMYVCNVLLDIIMAFLIWKRTGKFKIENVQSVKTDIVQEDLDELISYHEQTAQKLKNMKK